MFRSRNRRVFAGAWIAVLVAVAAVVVVLGVPITVGIGALWFATCLVPPVVLLMVWRGAPPPTMAEILYAVDRPE